MAFAVDPPKRFALPEAIAKFRKSIWFWVLYVLVLSLIVYALVTEFGSCLTLILAPVVMFVFPYWLKEKRLRVYAVNGLVVLLVAGLLFAYFFASAIYAGAPTENGSFESGKVLLTNGTVSPMSGAPNAEYNFTVTLQDTTGIAGAYGIQVNTSYVHATDLLAGGLNSGPSVVMNNDGAPLATGRHYWATMPLPDDIYLFYFSAHKAVGTNSTWYETPAYVGPIVAGFGTFLTFSFIYGMLGLMLPVVAFYYLILMLYWYTRRARQMRGPTGTVTPAETDTGFMCTNCGADVPEDAQKCPKCGAVFESGEDTEPEKEPPKEEPPKMEPPGAGPPGAEPPKAGEGPDAKP